MKELLTLFFSFFKVGLFTFGGGYAMLPLLQDELVKKKKWTTDEELLDYFSIGQCTPGVIAVNVSTFIGYKRKGILGGCIATLGIIAPSIIIITLIAAVLSIYMGNTYVNYAFAGIRIAVTALILETLIKLGKKGVSDHWGIAIFLCACLLLILFNVSAIIIVILAALAGTLIYALPQKKKGKKE